MEVIFLDIAMTLANYIFVNSISSANQKQTITDIKTDLRMMKDDLMNEIKLAREQILAEDKENTMDLMGQVKESSGGGS